ncbi:MAG: hypothetical protein HRT37_19715 [Alteromonadaceae bacterium]|nr:hypothetical protein [Alteromonadaceae bacterium]
MKKLLILIVAIALFLHFYPQPEVNNKFDEMMTIALDTFSNATDTKVRLKADTIYTDLKNELNGFTEDEVNYLKEITRNRDSVETFYLDYCKTGKNNPKFHAINLGKVCKTITRYQKYF